MVKIVLTGGTGLIGSACLTHCLAHPAISTVVALTRRPIDSPDSQNTKLKNIIVTDFSSLSEEVQVEFTSSDACIW